MTVPAKRGRDVNCSALSLLLTFCTAGSFHVGCFDRWPTPKVKNRGEGESTRSEQAIAERDHLSAFASKGWLTAQHGDRLSLLLSEPFASVISSDFATPRSACSASSSDAICNC